MKLRQMIGHVAPSDATVLIRGRERNRQGGRRPGHPRGERPGRTIPSSPSTVRPSPKAFWRASCSGIARGPSPARTRDRVGLFEAARGGTIFLDEIGEAGLAVQAKLLRVLEDKKINRVGDPIERAVDVRVIAATNRPLEEAIAAKNFREDLYYRLLVFPVDVPPLRERADDIPLLVEHFLDRMGRPRQEAAGGDPGPAAFLQLAGQCPGAAQPHGTGSYPGGGSGP